MLINHVAADDTQLVGGLSLYDDRLRDIVNKTPFTMERRKKLSGSYKVFTPYDRRVK